MLAGGHHTPFRLKAGDTCATIRQTLVRWEVQSMTQPEVFIFESLRIEDEERNRFEGKIIADVLNLGGKQSEYYYIRTKMELVELLDTFYDFKYRYLHFSCHANPDSMATTFESIGFEELGEILRPYIHQRRIFLSACSMVNDNLAKAILPNSDCYSIIGPSVDVRISDSAAFWASFYHLVFKDDLRKMKRDSILSTCKSLAHVFNIPLNYYSASRNSPDGFKLTKIDNNGKVIDRDK
jgi:hypothetical protein